MEPVQPIPKRKPSIAALEKLVSDAEEMANGPTTGDSSLKNASARNLPKVPAFNAPSTPVEAAVPALSRTPSRSPPMPTQVLPRFPNSTLQDWPYVLSESTELDAGTAEALSALSGTTWLDEPVFSPAALSAGDSSFDWSLYNQETGSSLMLTAPGSLDYYNIAPPNQLRNSSFSSDSSNQSSPFGMLFPAVPVPIKAPRIKQASSQFLEVGPLQGEGKWNLSYREEGDSLQLEEVHIASENSVLQNDLSTGFLSLSYIPGFSSTDQMDGWDPTSNDITTTSSTTSNFSTCSASGEEVLSFDKEVERYVEETFRNYTDDVKKTWLAFLKKVISEDVSSKDFWLSPENGAIWAGMAQLGNASDLTEADSVDVNTFLQSLEQPLDWQEGMENLGNLNLMETMARDVELFGIEFNDPILHQGRQVMENS